MKQQLTLFIMILIGCATFATSSFAATSQPSNAAASIGIENPIETSNKQGFFKKRITKKIKKIIAKWENKTTKSKDDSSDEVSTWTWLSVGLIAASLLFPPLAFGAIITSVIAMRKNKTADNLGDLDKVLAITCLITSLVISLTLLLVVALVGGFFLLGFWEV